MEALHSSLTNILFLNASLHACTFYGRLERAKRVCSFLKKRKLLNTCTSADVLYYCVLYV